MKQQLNINNFLRPKKSLGQNFIKDQKFLEDLSNIIKCDARTDIIEIGPGRGALTKKLIKKQFNNMFLIEKDTVLSNNLIEQFKNKSNIKIINKDALLINYDNLNLSDKVIIIGNLPYNISSQLLVRWLTYYKWPPFYNKMYLMFQYELGKKIISKKNSKNYGRISVLAQSRCEIKEKIIAPAKIFFPTPKVNGIVLEFTPILKNKDVNLELLQEILRKAFEKRRKKIKNSLSIYKDYFTDWDVQSELRPQDLDVEDYCNLIRNIS